MAFAWIAPPLSHLYPAPGHVFEQWKGAIAPEPLEEVRSMLALAAPFVLAAVVLAGNPSRTPRRSVDWIIVSVQIAAGGLLVWMVLEQTGAGPLLSPHYFKPLLLSPANLILGICIGLLLTGAILRWDGELSGWARAADRRLGSFWLIAGIAVLATVIFVLPAVVTDGTVGQAGPLASNHIPVQAEDYFSVVNGRTPLVNYIAQYVNLLPLAVEPVLATFHSSITAYSVAVCVLSTAGLMAIFGAFNQVTRRPWAALGLYLPFIALALFPWRDVGAHRNFDATYYGVLPGRLFGPFVLAWLCALSTRRRIPVWALFTAGGLVLLNNAEFGVAAIVGLVVALGVSWDRSIPLGRRLRTLAVEGGAGLLGAILLVCAITLLRSGELPNPSLLTYWNRIFLKESFGLQAMPSLGLHWALYATYAAALLIAAVRYVRADPDRTLTAMLAFSGAFGLVTAMYFVGRSSQFQLMLLFPAWGFSLALVAWAAGRALWSAAGDRIALRRLLLPATAALIGFGVMVSSIDRVSPPWRQVDRLIKGGPAVNDQLAAQHYVEAHTRPGEKVLILGTSLDHRVAERAGVVNVSPLNGVEALISRAEADRSLDQLQGEGGTQVFEAVTNPPQTGAFPFRIPEFAAILRERGYREVGQDPASGLTLWRRAAG